MLRTTLNGAQEAKIRIFERLGLSPNVPRLVPFPTYKYHVGLKSAHFITNGQVGLLAKNNPNSVGAQIAMDSLCESRNYVPAIIQYVYLFCLKEYLIG